MELDIGELVSLLDILDTVKKEKGLNVVDTMVYNKLRAEYKKQSTERNAKIMEENSDWDLPN